MIYFFAGYIILASVLGYILCALDKSYAKKPRHRRIRERTLFLTAAVGGSIGVWIGMYSLRHKTKHMSFVIGIPAILLAQVVLVLFLMYFNVL